MPQMGACQGDSNGQEHSFRGEEESLARLQPPHEDTIVYTSVPYMWYEESLFPEANLQMSIKKTQGDSPGLSRREFARRAALVTAAAIVPASRLSDSAGVPLDAEKSLPGAEDPALAKLSPQSRARFESMLRNVLQKHGDRFTEEQKTRLRKIVAYNVRMLEAVYAVPLQNGDAPATLLKLVENKSNANGVSAPLPRPAPAPKMNAKPRKSIG